MALTAGVPYMQPGDCSTTSPHTCVYVMPGQAVNIAPKNFASPNPSCMAVVNNSSQTIMVPTASALEWNSFNGALASGSYGGLPVYGTGCIPFTATLSDENCDGGYYQGGGYSGSYWTSCQSNFNIINALAGVGVTVAQGASFLGISFSYVAKSAEDNKAYPSFNLGDMSASVNANSSSQRGAYYSGSAMVFPHAAFAYYNCGGHDGSQAIAGGYIFQYNSSNQTMSLESDGYAQSGDCFVDAGVHNIQISGYITY